MIKAARKAAANTELARVFADIFRAPTHEHRATQGRQGGRRGAGCEWVERCESAGRAKQRVALIIKQKKQRGKCPQICNKSPAGDENSQSVLIAGGAFCLTAYSFLFSTAFLYLFHGFINVFFNGFFRENLQVPRYLRSYIRSGSSDVYSVTFQAFARRPTPRRIWSGESAPKPSRTAGYTCLKFRAEPCLPKPVSMSSLPGIFPVLPVS